MKDEIFYEGCICPVCEVGRLHLLEKSLEFEYKDDKFSLQRVVWVCTNCHESFLQAKDERKVEKLLTDRRRQVDGLLTSEEIKAIRKGFKMTQTEFAKVLRVSEKMFARYENGQAMQGYAMDNLLRILREYPETLKVITNIDSEPKLKTVRITKHREEKKVANLLG